MLKKLLITIPVLLVVGVVAGYGYINYRTRAAVDARLADMVASGAYEAITYETLQVLPNGNLSMQNLHMVMPTGELILQDIQVSNFDYSSPVPRHMDIVVKGLQLPSGWPGAAQSFNGPLAGLFSNDTLPLEVSYQHRYEPETDFRLQSDMQVNLPQAFDLAIKSNTSNLDLQDYNNMGALDPDPAIAQLQLMEKLARLEIDTISIALQDLGLLEKLLAASAAQNGVPPEDLRRMLSTQASNLHLFLPQNMQALAMDTGAQLATFLEGGKTLSVSIEPGMNGSYSLLQQEIMAAVFIGNFSHIVELLQLEISAQ